MRARMIKPAFFSDPELANVPIGAQMLFVGLWCLADREGRLLDAPRMIAGAIFPFRQDVSDEDVENWLQHLAERRFIIRYQARGVRCIQIRTFAKHQKIHPRELPSSLPAPPDDDGPNGSPDCSLGAPSKPTSLGKPSKVSSLGKPSERSSLGKPSLGTPSKPASLGAPEHEYEHEHENSGDIQLPNTPLTPQKSPPPPLIPVEISPRAQAAVQAPVCESPQLAHAMPMGDHGPAIVLPGPRRAASACDPPQKLGDFAIQVTRRMLRDWMERHADRLPPPDDDLCRRLLVAHGMSLDRLRDWLLALRRRGKRPESVQSWGWFANLAEAEAARDGHGEPSPAAAGRQR